MSRTLRLFFGFLARSLCTRRNLLLENLALRQQLTILRERHPQPRFRTHDRLFWMLLSRLWPAWERALVAAFRRHFLARCRYRSLLRYKTRPPQPPTNSTIPCHFALGRNCGEGQLELRPMRALPMSDNDDL